MDFNRITSSQFIHQLRGALPLPAHARPALIVFLRERGVVTRGAPRLVILDVFNAGEVGGLMCRFAVAENSDSSNFIAPLAQVALERRHPARLRAGRRRSAPPSGAA